MDSEVFIYLPADTSFLVLDYRSESKQRLFSGSCHIMLIQKTGRGNQAEGEHSLLRKPSLISILTEATLPWTKLLSSYFKFSVTRAV